MEKSHIERQLSFYYRLKAKAFTLLMSGAFHSVGSHVSVVPPLRFGNLSRIQLGNRVTIHANCWLQVLVTPDTPCDSANIVFADDVTIGMNATISAAKRISFGSHVMTARNVYVSDHEHEFHDVDTPIALQGIGKIREVSIGDGSWLGQNVVVLPGVTIGRHCVIAANSVVNRSVPDFSIAGGVPARILRRFSAESGLWEKVDR